jgi:hypothetical protein
MSPLSPVHFKVQLSGDLARDSTTSSRTREKLHTRAGSKEKKVCFVN